MGGFLILSNCQKLRLAFFLSKLPCFPRDIPGRCLGNVEIDDSGEVW